MMRLFKLLFLVTLFVVISNGDGKRRHGNSMWHARRAKQQERVAEPINPGRLTHSTPSGMSRKFSITFPIWVTVDNLKNIGATTTYKYLGDRKYIFKLPFVFQVNENNVLFNQSAVQTHRLTYPFWVEVDKTVKNRPGNLSGDAHDEITLPFPFKVEVNHMIIVKRETDPVHRSGTALAITGSVIGAIIGGIIIAHIIRSAVNTAVKVAVELLTPHNAHANGQVNSTPRSWVGKGTGWLMGTIVNILPVFSDKLKGGLQHLAQSLGDSVVMFFNEVTRFHLIGDIKSVVNIIFSILHFMIPIIPKFQLVNNRPNEYWKVPKTPGTPVIEVERPPPIVFPPPSGTSQNSIIIIIFPGQRYIQEYPQVIIVWPGQSEPRNSGYVIVRPNQPRFLYHPDVLLIWPGQSPNLRRPFKIIIVPGQKYIPTYDDVVLVWPGTNTHTEFGKIEIRYPEVKIPDAFGVLLLWPVNNRLSRKPIAIFIYPGQKQIPGYPNVIITWPGQQLPRFPPGFIILSPGNQIPGHPEIIIIWPGYSPPGNVIIEINLTFGERQVPGFPEVIILWPGVPIPPQQPGMIYVMPGNIRIQKFPFLILKWPHQPYVADHNDPMFIVIPPGFTQVPCYPNIFINRNGNHHQQMIKQVTYIYPGSRILPGHPKVILVWLEYPSDIAVAPPPTPPTIEPPPPIHPPDRQTGVDITIPPQAVTIREYPYLICIRPHDKFVPGYPSIFIIRPNFPESSQHYFGQYVYEGDLQMPGLSNKYLIWLPHYSVDNQPVLHVKRTFTSELAITIVMSRPLSKDYPNSFVIPSSPHGNQGTHVFVIPTESPNLSNTIQVSRPFWQ